VAGAVPGVNWVVGLTGGIGSGKSTAAACFARLGVTVVDTDEISRALTASGGEATAALREAFGAEYLTASGALDRDAMRRLVFEDPLARARLEAILHPRIRGAADAALAGAPGPYAMLAVPLLFETGGYARRVQRTLVIDCPEHLQVERASRRSRLEPATVRAVMAAQWPRWRRLQAADDVAWNGGSEAALEALCESFHARYLALAAHSHLSTT
jgi:dephospho-CoA kinase